MLIKSVKLIRFLRAHLNSAILQAIYCYREQAHLDRDTTGVSLASSAYLCDRFVHSCPVIFSLLNGESLDVFFLLVDINITLLRSIHGNYEKFVKIKTNVFD